MWDFFFNKPANTTPPAPVPVHPLTREALRLAPDRSLYRLGHSTVLLRLRGGWWLTDPVFSERASPVQFLGPKRFHAPPISLAELPPLRGVILSHDHYDHLDRRAIKALASKTEVFLSPLGVGDRLAAWGVSADRIRQFDWWQDVEIDGLRLTATPAQHFPDAASPTAIARCGRPGDRGRRVARLLQRRQRLFRRLRRNRPALRSL